MIRNQKASRSYKILFIIAMLLLLAFGYLLYGRDSNNGDLNKQKDVITIADATHVNC